MNQRSTPGSSDGEDPSTSGTSVRVYPLAVCFVWAVLLVLFLAFFEESSTVLLGFLAASIVACALAPLLKYVPGPRAVAAGVVGIGLIAGVGAAVFALSYPLAAPIRAELNAWPQSEEKIDAQLLAWSNQLGLDTPLTVERLANTMGGFFAEGSGTRVVTGGADILLEILIWLAFIFVGSIFLLADAEHALLRPALLLVPKRHRGSLSTMATQLAPRYRRWVLGTMTGMLIVGSVSSLGYSAIGLEFWLPLAILAGLAEVVPTVGPACAFVVALLFAATQGWAVVLGAIVVYAIVQALEAYIVLPLIMKGAVKIHPAVTLFTVVLWGKIFGLPGLVLAIPINLTLFSLVYYLYVLPRDRRLGEHPPSTPKAAADRVEPVPNIDP